MNPPLKKREAEEDAKLVPPKGKVWKCQACGKVNRGHLYELEKADYGFDEWCAVNAALADEVKNERRTKTKS